jgi:NAD(P)-dependent dehydrogenase (short-subunit alcohol dehydrogenase family)
VAPLLRASPRQQRLAPAAPAALARRSYNAAKGGVNNLTRSMALALAPHGIRVNAIGPGSIRTDVLASVVADQSAMDKVGGWGGGGGGGGGVVWGVGDEGWGLGGCAGEGGRVRELLLLARRQALLAACRRRLTAPASGPPQVLSRTPLGRVGEPEEIAGVAVFLASGDSSYVSGEVIYVDGGRLALNYTVPVPASQ